MELQRLGFVLIAKVDFCTDGRFERKSIGGKVKISPYYISVKYRIICLRIAASGNGVWRAAMLSAK